MDLNQILITEFLGNTTKDYLCFVSAILLGLIFKKLISKYLSQLLFKIVKTKDIDVGADTFNNLLIKPIGLCVMLSIIYLGSSYIQYPITWDLASVDEIGLKMIINKGFSLLFIYSVFWIFLRMIDFVGLIPLKKSELTAVSYTHLTLPTILLV